MYKTLYIIGNGFDLMHRMKTSYADFRRWLLINNKIDILFELQTVFPERINNSYLLWSDFEKALGLYDSEIAATWDIERLLLTEDTIGGQSIFSPTFILDPSLKSIVNDSFCSWVNQIEMVGDPIISFKPKSVFLSFNYTDTLEKTYDIPGERVLHIHGSCRAGNGIIVGHRYLVDPFDFTIDGVDFRENNSRIQHMCEINDLYKPIEKIIDKHHTFFDDLSQVSQVIVMGHSCNEIDWPYFEKIKESVHKYAQWQCSWYTEQDIERVSKLMDHIRIDKCQWALYKI